LLSTVFVIENRKLLCHSLGRPSRSDFVQFQFLEGFGKIHGYAERNIYLLPMLMYGKEASNRKQEIDRQHHTIPNQRDQRPKDKHYGNMHNRLWNHG
jgi:hypothetical protein